MHQSPPRAQSNPIAILISAAGLMAAAPAALAQVTQTLSVEFVNFSAVPAPLSDWLTAAVALLLAISAIVVLRRQTGRAGRLFGWMLAVVAGTTLFAAAGQRPLSEALAIVGSPAISLTASPATLGVTQFAPTSPLNITVTNNSGQLARITSVAITSDNAGAAAERTIKLVPGGFYGIHPSSTCVAGTVLSTGNSCTVTIFGGAD